MTYASDFVSPKGRFARSVNVERDAGSNQIDGYLPTGRALDVIGRIARAVGGGDPSRAFSITGPYGTGKSSLAVFLDALLGPEGDPATQAAASVLSAVDPGLLELLKTGTHDSSLGFIRAVVTATREPVSATVIRALAHGAHRFAPRRGRSGWTAVVRDLDDAVAGLTDRDRALPTSRFILDTISALGRFAPVLLVIDEFGKNLEAFTESRSDADLYLLQELVEWSHADGDRKLPLLMITMQHLAFEEYLDSSSLSVRREWAKVQGRFEDIPYVDTPRQTRHLIAQVHEHSHSPEWDKKRKRWVRDSAQGLRYAGVNHEIEESLLDMAWPLHPSVLMVLPDLCARYGQNERTLFSFLASSEPLAVPAWLAENVVGSRLGDVRLERVYDYFVESASTMVGTSQSASRWLEVETVIRDAGGLSPSQRRVLKAVGLLNLISAGGAVRASRRIVVWACADGQPGTKTEDEVDSVLAQLEQAGRITYRDFADEFRLWRGSDLDLRSAIDAARRRAKSRPIEELLTSTRKMLPIVAARHSTRTGTLRAFRRVWDSDGSVTPLGPGDPADGLLVYLVGSGIPAVLATDDHPKPVVAVRPSQTGGLIDTAIELAAIRSVLEDDGIVGDDWVARRELGERESEAMAAFNAAFESAVGHNAESADWWLIAADADPRPLPKPVSVTAQLSTVCDEAYSLSPRVPNEMLNRHELTSQGAKARRLLIEGLLGRVDEPRFGIDGFPPERAMYDAVFGATGIHREVHGTRQITRPLNKSGWSDAWASVEQLLDRAKQHRIGLDRIVDELVSPPIGMKTAVAPLLIVAVIIDHRAEVAIYEHGTYKPRLTPELAERLLKNPSHFQVKHFAATRGPRRAVVEAIAEAMRVGGGWKQTTPTVLSVVGHLVALVNGLSEYARRTKEISPQAQLVRRALLDATEPDSLLFDALPRALGHEPIGIQRATVGNRDAYVQSLIEAVNELERVQGSLTAFVIDELCRATATARPDCQRSLSVRAKQIEGVLDQRLRGFMSALGADQLAETEWAEHLLEETEPIERLRFASNLAELGGTFRRIEAINFDVRARQDSAFDAIRVTVTRPDGSEQARVVAIDDAQRRDLQDHLDALIARATALTGNAAQGLEAALGLLGERLVPGHAGDISPSAGSVPASSERLRKVGSQ